MMEPLVVRLWLWLRSCIALMDTGGASETCIDGMVEFKIRFVYKFDLIYLLTIH